MKQKKLPIQHEKNHRKLSRLLKSLTQESSSYLDLIKQDTLVEKAIHLVLEGSGFSEEAAPIFNQIIQEVRQYPTGSWCAR